MTHNIHLVSKSHPLPGVLLKVRGKTTYLFDKISIFLFSNQSDVNFGPSI